MSPITAILSGVEAAVAKDAGTVAQSVATAVDDVRSTAADAVAKVGVGAAAQIAPPGNKYQTIIKAASADWRTWALLAGGLVIVVYLARRR